MRQNPSLLYVTDLHYEARGRVYAEEDLSLSKELSSSFDLVLCSPHSAARYVHQFDLTLFRNAGPVIHYSDEYAAFREAARSSGERVFNPLSGRGDMQGKRYLLELTDEGFPVIPTIDRVDALDRLPACDRYVVKPLWGADSIGMRFLEREQLLDAGLDREIVQPALDLEYEVSFFFLNDRFQYALYAPDPLKRWLLVPYQPSAEDLAFANCFIEWNAMRHGIQRVDGARLEDGRLLLMELEDLNPFLSLDRLPAATRATFVANFREALFEYLAA